VLPGETAPAHRHTAFAVRFIVEGSGGFTAIHGKRIKMARGDFILTPSWKYHVSHATERQLMKQDHGNDGVADPMIWLDGLDLPQYQHFPVHFAQHYSQPRYPAEDATSSDIHFPWSHMQAKLDASGGKHRIVRYTSQESGKEDQDVSVRLGAQCEYLEGKSSSETSRENASSVYHVIEGEGKTAIGATVIEWTKGDTFAVPAWEPYVHEVSPLSAWLGSSTNM
jgi:gentisate 1,2-dioxygenase